MMSALSSACGCVRRHHAIRRPRRAPRRAARTLVANSRRGSRRRVRPGLVRARQWRPGKRLRLTRRDPRLPDRAADRPACDLHDEIPTREGHCGHDLEGSYAPVAELASVDHLGAKWLFNNHGHRTLEWDDHCNRAYTRWILREHGIALAGPAPRSFMPPVTKELMRGEAAASLPILLEDLATWVDIDTLACLLAPLSTEAIHLGRRVGRSLQPLPAEAVGWHSSAANWFTSMFLAAVEGAGSQPSDRTRRVR